MVYEIQRARSGCILHGARPDNHALNLRVQPLASLCFYYNNVYTFLLCTYTSTVSALTLILMLALSLLYINTYTSTVSTLTLSH
jgi:hypothetical protein